MPEYITRVELAAMLRLSVQTLESPRFRRSGPGFVRIGRTVRYPREVVLSWLASRQVEVRP